MIFFSIINPDVEFPYEIELNSSAEKPPSLPAKYFEKMLREKMTMTSKPQASKKYQKRQFSEWAHLEKLYLKCTAFDSFLRPCAEDVLLELNGNDEKEPSVLSRDASLEEKGNDKPPSAPSGETSLEEKVHNEPADRNSGEETGGKGTKRNACDNPLNVKKKAKVIEVMISPTTPKTMTLSRVSFRVLKKIEDSTSKRGDGNETAADEDSIQFYSGNKALPLFSSKPEVMNPERAVSTLLQKDLPSSPRICTIQPIEVYHHATFLVDLEALPSTQDIKCDDVGNWRNNSNNRFYFTLEAMDDNF
ncbi:uncharacterized protein LOC122949156 [Acropora millepora]|uniref:uncharacterized protein LOC122949156 n=1 Tax=Acropora millepora TaxID=45264 RepID=UPI001CF2670C|nr:uncharacterized protein LOC122949156 [Acropora millepora]